jgi:carboxymethylenebutenolidase
MCFEFDALPPDVPADRRRVPVSGGAGAEVLTLEAADGGRFSAAFAECPDPGATAVVILPDVRGLYRFYIELAERFVTAGHHAIAIDFFGRSAGTGVRDEDFDFMSELAAVTPAQVQVDIAAAVEEVRQRTGTRSFVTVGFCYGGAQSFLAGTNPDTGLDAVVGFYGTLDGERLGPIFPHPLGSGEATKVPVLGLFGGDDDLIPADEVATFDGQLEAAGVEHHLHTYPGAPHSFFDRSFDRFADEAADAWRRLLDFVAAAG